MNLLEQYQRVVVEPVWPVQFEAGKAPLATAVSHTNSGIRSSFPMAPAMALQKALQVHAIVFIVFWTLLSLRTAGVRLSWSRSECGACRRRR